MDKEYKEPGDELEEDAEPVVYREEVLSSLGVPDVEVELGFTKSMGEGTYEFLRVDIRHRGHVEEDEDINEATDRLYKNLEAVIVEKVNELDKALGPRGRTSQIHDNRK